MLRSKKPQSTGLEDRVIALGPGLPPIPERLLLAHSRGEVLFIVGAGVSRASGLPDFRRLVIDVYEELDKVVHSVISSIPALACNRWATDVSRLTSQQAAEVQRFILGDYDVVLGMLERRMDDRVSVDSRVRTTVAKCIRAGNPTPAQIHKDLMRLADRGVLTIATTNFDTLLEDAVPKRKRSAVRTYALGDIPRPGRNNEFAGVFHIHGALPKRAIRASNLVVSDQDFGEFYLRRRVVPDLIYDAARLFHLVLVGYSANDPPMRYLLNAVAADGKRFDDLKERFTFVGGESPPNPADLEDWRGRGITPIHYDHAAHHKALSALLGRWADLSSINGRQSVVDSEIRRIVKARRSAAPVVDRDIFDHLVRRATDDDRRRIAAIASKSRADIGWLDAVIDIVSERGQGAR